MIADPGTYSLEDFIPFTAEVYLRLIERQNEAFWPGHVAAVLVGAAAIALAWRGSGRTMAMLLIAAWAWVAVTFHLRLFAELTFVANGVGGAFLLQAAVMIGMAMLGGLDRREPPGTAWLRAVGCAISVAGVALYPLLATQSEAGWMAAQTFAMTPDPTVLATLGLILMSARPRWWLAVMPIPLAWCALSGLIGTTLDLPFAWVMPAAAILCVLIMVAAGLLALRR